MREREMKKGNKRERECVCVCVCACTCRGWGRVCAPVGVLAVSVHMFVCIIGVCVCVI